MTIRILAITIICTLLSSVGLARSCLTYGKAGHIEAGKCVPNVIEETPPHGTSADSSTSQAELGEGIKETKEYKKYSEPKRAPANSSTE